LFRVRTDPAAVEHIAPLPSDALVPYAQVLGVLEVAPWNGAPYNRSKPDGNMRQLVFGASGNGIVTYLILDDQRLVDVLKVQWAG
jgi:hypothetical protein